MMDQNVIPILLLGAGRMGGAMMAGWFAAGAVTASDLMVRDPHPPADLPAGVRLNPPEAAFMAAKTVLLAVKPQYWRQAAAELAPLLSPTAIIVSIVAGVPGGEIAKAFDGRPVARVMPTTAVAILQGTASLFAPDPSAEARARALFEPVAKVVALADEDLMHAATAASGSAPAYFYALVAALEAAAIAEGLTQAAAATLARSTLSGAAALLAASEVDPAELRRQVTSPGGTTQAALEVLLGEAALPALLRRAVAAAAARSRILAAQ
jgi:pyrroline-5-carboxylate reductase